jgi:hypothetical protein
MARWARVLLVVAGVLAVWSLVVALSGGARYEIGPVRLSSRNPVRPLLVAMLLAVIAWRLAYEDWLERRLRRALVAADFADKLIVVVAAGLVLVVTLLYAVRVAGGADPLGYVSESALWLQGNLRIDQSFAATMPWPSPEGTLAPLGYRPSNDVRFMVPTYAPGLPLLMASARLVSSCGPYLIAPISGAALVVLTYLLGRRVFGRASALAGAVLTASSPTVLYMSIFPMADVPAATCWMAALLVGGPSTGRAAATGVLTGIAVAIRPNLVPLSAFPWLLMILRERGMHSIAVRTAAFAAGAAPFVGLVAWTNDYLYGSPFTSGYGNLAPGFAVEHAATNLVRYPAWWLQSQGPLAFLFLLSLVRLHTVSRRAARVLIGFSAAVFLSYLFYLPFEAWWFLRFLLPAIPLAFLLCADAVQWATAHFSVSVRLLALVAFTVATLAHAVTFNGRIPLSQVADGEQKYVDAGVFIERATPPHAVIIASQHSGSIRYYSGRLTLRYDLLESDWLDRAIDVLERTGRPVYLLLDDWEEPVFRARFAGQRSLVHLDRGPAATGRAGRLLFYTVNAAPVELTSPRIPRTSRFECRDMSSGFTTAGQMER